MNGITLPGSMNRASAGLLLRMVAVCTVGAVIFALGIATLCAGAVLAFASPQEFEIPVQHLVAGNPQTFSGVITDTHCGAKHANDTGQSASGCTRLCVKQGSAYALVSGDSVLQLNGDSGYLDRFAGQRVKIWGSLEGAEIRVDSVESLTPAK